MYVDRYFDGVPLIEYTIYTRLYVKFFFDVDTFVVKIQNNDLVFKWEDLEELNDELELRIDVLEF